MLKQISYKLSEEAALYLVETDESLNYFNFVLNFLIFIGATSVNNNVLQVKYDKNV